jgi:hypothetical protein
MSSSSEDSAESESEDDHPHATDEPPETGDGAVSLTTLLTVVVFIAAALCYVNSLNGDFLFDDAHAVQLNKDLDAKTPLRELFKHDFWGLSMSHEGSMKSYRPVSTLTFRAEKQLYGLKPYWFHRTNLLLHATVSALLVRVCALLLHGDSIAAGIAGMVFAVHPVHVDAVASIVGRAELLAALFFLAALHQFMSHGGRFLGTLACVIFGAMATLSKEHGITVFGVCAVYAVLFFCGDKLDPGDFLGNRDKFFRDLAKRTSTPITQVVVVVGAAVLILALRLSIGGGIVTAFTPVDNPAAFAPTFVSRFLTNSWYATRHLWFIINPLQQYACDWSGYSVPLVTSFADPRCVGIASMYLFWGLMCWFSLSKSIQLDIRRRLLFGCAVAVVSFLPASNIAFPVGFAIAERVLYLPSAGICIMLAVLVSALGRRPMIKRLFLLSIAAYVLLSANATVAGNKRWKNADSLFGSALSVNPNNSRMLRAMTGLTTDHTRKEQLFKQLVTMHKDVPATVSRNNAGYGMFLREHKRLEEAETYLKIGAEAVLQNTQAWETLAVVQYQLEMYKDAVATWKTILMRFPKNPTIWMSVANTQANKLNQREQAASSYAKVAAFSGPQTQLGHQARQWLQQHGAGNGGGGHDP